MKVTASAVELRGRGSVRHGSFKQILVDVDFFLSLTGMDNIPLTDHARMDIVRVDRESRCAVDTINRVSSRMNTVEPRENLVTLGF